MAMHDGCGRAIDYLRVSLTDRCNLRCVYCMPEEGVCPLRHEDVLRLEEMLEVVSLAVQRGVTHVRLTGGEPLVRRNVTSFVERVAALPGVEDVSLTTNATLLPRFAKGLAAAGLRRVNVSLDTLDPEQYRLITRVGNLKDALAGIRSAFEAGLEPVKLNTVVVRSLEQDLFAFAKLTLNAPLHVRFIEYMPLGTEAADPGLGWTEHDVVPAAEMIERINAAAIAAGVGPLQPIDPLAAHGGEVPLGAGPARYCRFPGAQGTVGFISSLSNHFCSSCNRLRLTADGKLRPCLFSDREFDVKAPLRAGNRTALEAVLDQVLAEKPDEHHHRVGTRRAMSQMGG